MDTVYLEQNDYQINPFVQNPSMQFSHTFLFLNYIIVNSKLIIYTYVCNLLNVVD